MRINIFVFKQIVKVRDKGWQTNCFTDGCFVNGLISLMYYVYIYIYMHTHARLRFAIMLSVSIFTLSTLLGLFRFWLILWNYIVFACFILIFNLFFCFWFQEVWYFHLFLFIGWLGMIHFGLWVGVKNWIWLVKNEMCVAFISDLDQPFSALPSSTLLDIKPSLSLSDCVATHLSTVTMAWQFPLAWRREFGRVNMNFQVPSGTKFPRRVSFPLFFF